VKGAPAIIKHSPRLVAPAPLFLSQLSKLGARALGADLGASADRVLVVRVRRTRRTFVKGVCAPGFVVPVFLPGFLFMSLFVALVVFALGDNYASRLPLSCQPSAPDDTSPSLCPSSGTQR
jgi:hypothetical protein